MKLHPEHMDRHNCDLRAPTISIVYLKDKWHLWHPEQDSDVTISFCPFCGFCLAPGDYTIGSSMISAERIRQVQMEVWSAAHDDGLDDFQLSNAALSYIMAALGKHLTGFLTLDQRLVFDPKFWWPFADGWWKPTSRMKNLIKAGALICAEIDRLWRTGEGLEGLDGNNEHTNL